MANMQDQGHARPLIRKPSYSISMQTLPFHFRSRASTHTQGGGGGRGVAGQEGSVGALTSMPVGIHCIGSCYGKVVQQAEAMAASGVVSTGHHPCGTRVMPRGSDCAESIPYLRACMDATGIWYGICGYC